MVAEITPPFSSSLSYLPYTVCPISHGLKLHTKLFISHIGQKYIDAITNVIQTESFFVLFGDQSRFRAGGHDVSSCRGRFEGILHTREMNEMLLGACILLYWKIYRLVKRKNALGENSW